MNDMADTNYTASTSSAFGGSFTLADLEKMHREIIDSEYKLKQEFGKKIGMNPEDIFEDSIFFVSDKFLCQYMPPWIKTSSLNEPNQIIHTRKKYIEINPKRLVFE